MPPLAKVFPSGENARAYIQSFSRQTCNIFGNSLSSNVTSGGNDTALNDFVVDGTVNVTGPNTF
jgi:hypothetical protein